MSAQPAYELIKGAEARLGTHPDPRLEAERLLAHVLGVSRSALLARLRESVPGAQVPGEYQALVARRAAGEPLAYVLGHAPFHALDLQVTPAVLIPRPETECLLEWAIARVAGRGGRAAVLDVGTGSGALALGLAAACPHVTVLATDNSAAALDVAAANARRLGLADRVTFELADLLPDGVLAFDVVVANLPYVALSELPDVESSVLDYEPHGALFGGPDGLDLIRRLLIRLPGRLLDRPPGRPPGSRTDVGLEIGWRQGASVVALAQAAFPAADVRLRQDLAGLDRLVTVEGRSDSVASDRPSA